MILNYLRQKQHKVFMCRYWKHMLSNEQTSRNIDIDFFEL